MKNTSLPKPQKKRTLGKMLEELGPEGRTKFPIWLKKESRSAGQ